MWWQDTKNKYIPHKATTYYFITSAWSIYCSFTQLFVIFIAFGQLDLLLFRLGSDLLANYFTLSIYLYGKIHDPEMHAKTSSHQHTNGSQQGKEGDGTGAEDVSSGDSLLTMTEPPPTGSRHHCEMVDFKQGPEQENVRLLAAKRISTHE